MWGQFLPFSSPQTPILPEIVAQSSSIIVVMTATSPTPDQDLLTRVVSGLDFNDGQTVAMGPHHQGEVRLFELNEPGLPERIIIKKATGKGWRRWASLRTLRHEHTAYQRLCGVVGIPPCLGFVSNAYLVLGYVSGRPIKPGERLPQKALEQLKVTISNMHEQGVAHGDLKRHANILLTEADDLVVIDFGTAWLKKSGFHPLNHWVFKFLAQTDLNAWIKHKYLGYDGVDPIDQAILKRSGLERMLTYWRSRKRSKP